MGVVAGYAGVSLIRQPFRRVAKGFPVPDFIPFRAFEVRVLFHRYGSGKTTLLNTLYGFITPSTGHIAYKNRPLKRKDIAYLEAENY
jgi:ABC-type phosphonate transport system ATPase subunit